MVRYILANDKGKYIGIDPATQKHRIVNDIDEALRWKTEQAANNSWVNNLSKVKMFEKQFFFPLEVQEPEVLNDEEKALIEEMASDDITSKYLNDEPFELEELEQWKKIVGASMKMLTNILNARQKVNDQLKDVEKEIIDLHHYMEFNQLSAVQGYQAYKMLRERLLLRTALRDMNNIYSSLDDYKITGKQLEDLAKRVVGMENREYNPRRMNELFEKDAAKQEKKAAEKAKSKKSKKAEEKAEEVAEVVENTEAVEETTVAEAIAEVATTIDEFDLSTVPTEATTVEPETETTED